jgi:nucleoside-diphosphate-sugar epimerase
MRVVITGAAGGIGQAMLDELAPFHELRLLDVVPMPDPRARVVDLARPPRPSTRWRRLWPAAAGERWSDAFEDADVVLHLAAQTSPTASWEEVLRNNVQATWNVGQAATAHRVTRIVFASSHWAVKALEHALAPACYESDGPKIGSDAAPRPLTPYGLSKAIGEQIGRVLVDEGRLESFLAVRIGYHLASPPGGEAERRLWVGAADLRSLLRRCVEVEREGFHLLYGISAQAASPFDLSHTRALLAWSPGQSA